MSAGVKVISTGIDYKLWANGKKQHIKDNEIVIGEHVWIGANALILAGVKITGRFVVIAAGSIVTKDITEDYCIVAGNPAKVIRNY